MEKLTSKICRSSNVVTLAKRANQIKLKPGLLLDELNKHYTDSSLKSLLHKC